jgi:hypothetical protein
VIAAGLSVFFIRSGFLFVFFLVPLSLLAFRYNAETAWCGFILAAAANSIFALIVSFGANSGFGGPLTDILFYVLIAGIFTWINSPLQSGGKFPKIPGLYRMILGSLAATALFIFIINRAFADPVFLEVLNSRINVLKSFYISESPDVVQNALVSSITPEALAGTARFIVLRGGGFLLAVLMFFGSRQTGIVVSTLLGKKFNGKLLRLFHVPPSYIWVLSFTLPLTVLARIAKFETGEIILWNILTLCVILYLAQGLGILQFYATRPALPPVLRIVLTVGFFILLSNPIISVFLLGFVILLGIAENWAPLRASKTDSGPPSTPEE